jgi:hypothetical protein
MKITAVDGELSSTRRRVSDAQLARISLLAQLRSLHGETDVPTRKCRSGCSRVLWIVIVTKAALRSLQLVRGEWRRGTSLCAFGCTSPPLTEFHLIRRGAMGWARMGRHQQARLWACSSRIYKCSLRVSDRLTAQAITIGLDSCCCHGHALHTAPMSGNPQCRGCAAACFTAFWRSPCQ